MSITKNSISSVKLYSYNDDVKRILSFSLMTLNIGVMSFDEYAKSTQAESKPSQKYAVTKDDQIEEFESWKELVVHCSDWKGVYECLRQMWSELDSSERRSSDYGQFVLENVEQALNECGWKVSKI